MKVEISEYFLLLLLGLPARLSFAVNWDDLDTRMILIQHQQETTVSVCCGLCATSWLCHHLSSFHFFVKGWRQSLLCELRITRKVCVSPLSDVLWGALALIHSVFFSLRAHRKCTFITTCCWHCRAWLFVCFLIWCTKGSQFPRQPSSVRRRQPICTQMHVHVRK